MLEFVRDNLRWLGTGFLLTFASAFGQTWFIALFAGEIKAVHGLSDGAWGSLYTVATLASAALLFLRGGLADTMPLARLVSIVALGFAVSCIALAYAPAIWVVGVAVFGLRFCGQGMFGHIALTAMGRWYRARRGRAVAIAALGHPAGEAFLPLPAIALTAALGWRGTWLVAAALLALALAPALARMLARGRVPQGATAGDADVAGLGGRHWRRTDVARHWLFPALLPMVLTPGFIGTVVFFHQVHIAEVKGWSLASMAPGLTVFAGVTVVTSFAAGWLADRFGPDRLLPGLLLPMGLGIALVGPAAHVPMWFLALGLLGVTQGATGALWGTLLPTIYGTRHLGAVRSLVTVIMVVSTAIGPGITGILIDRGIDFPAQCTAMGLWCLALCAAALAIRRRLVRETFADAPQPGGS